MRICMVEGSSLGAAENVPPRSVDEQSIEHRLHAGQLSGDLLSQGQIVPQCLWLDAADHPLRLRHQLIELLVRAHIKVAEPLEELAEVVNRRVAEDLGLAVFAATEPLGEVRHELR